MPATVRFRGVCLYVVESRKNQRLLRVLLPQTTRGVVRPSHDVDRNKKARHHARLSVFGPGAPPPPTNVTDISGYDLTILTDNPLTDVHLTDTFSLSTLVGIEHAPQDLSVAAGGKVKTSVRLGSGTVESDTPHPRGWLLPPKGGPVGHDQPLSHPRLEVVWTAPGTGSVDIVGQKNGSPTTLATISSAQTAVIGHYDILRDADDEDVKEVPYTGNVKFDADFEWLFDLLPQRSSRWNVPRLLPGNKIHPVGPLTSTCFGATWP